MVRLAPRPYRSVAALLVALLLGGCGRGGEADALFIDYQRRLADFLEVEAPRPATPDNIAAFPEQEARLFVIPDTREGLLDVYALRDCHVTSLVAKRNNQLGRVAAPSQRWLHELKLWRRLAACRQSAVYERLAEADRERLERLTTLKTEQLPRASWNALFASDEWVGSFSRASAPLPPDAAIALEESLAALAYLRLATLRQLDLDWQPDSSTLEGHLQALGREPLTARVLRSLKLAARRLDEASDMLQRYLEGDAPCPEAMTPGRWRETHYSPSVRPYLDELARTAHAWLAGLQALLEAHDVSRPAVDAYRRDWLSLDDAEAPWQRFEAARRQHGRHWERLIEACEPTSDKRGT